MGASEPPGSISEGRRRRGPTAGGVRGGRSDRGLPTRRTALLALVLFLPAAAPAQQHFPADEDLELMLRYLVEDGAAPGIVLGVLEADGTTRIVSYGEAGPDTRPLGPTTVFEIGSITKTFTATLLADMVRRGEVALDDPIARYLPEGVTVPSGGGRGITLVDLATHTSGLPSIGHRPENVYDPYADFTADDLYDFLAAAELRDAPGRRYRYSNLGMGLLGHLLARVAGTSYGELLRERVLDPLGMDMTSVTLDGAAEEQVARGHSERGAAPYRTWTDATYGQGGIYSTAEDLLKYLDAQVGPVESGLEASMRMTQEVRGANVDGAYGLAWHISLIGGDTIVHHGGTTTGFSTLIAFDPERRTGTVLLSNAARFPTDLGISLIPAAPPPPAWRTVDPAPSVLAAYAGRYASTSGKTSYYVRLEEEGFLTYQPTGKARARLYATSDTTFFLKRGPWSFTFRDPAPAAGVELLMEVDEREPTGEGMRVTARRVARQTPPPAAVAGYADFDAPRGPGIWGWVGLGALALVLLLVGPFRASLRTGG